MLIWREFPYRNTNQPLEGSIGEPASALKKCRALSTLRIQICLPSWLLVLCSRNFLLLLAPKSVCTEIAYIFILNILTPKSGSKCLFSYKDPLSSLFSEGRGIIKKIKLFVFSFQNYLTWVPAENICWVNAWSVRMSQCLCWTLCTVREEAYPQGK